MALPRTQSSVAVSADGRRWALLNASPDLRQQFIANPELHPQKGLRDTPVACVVLTNADVDHVAGLLTMRERQPFALWASRRVHAALAANPIFGVLHPDCVERRVLEMGASRSLTGPGAEAIDLEIEPFAVPGKVALYLEDATAGADFGTEEGDTIGLRVGQPSTGAKFFYIPGCAKVNAALAARLRGARLVLFDGTLFTDDEMIVAGLGQKTGRRMGHISVSGPEGSLAAFADLGVERRIFVHINNTNPVLIEDSPERRAVQESGWEVAYDGLKLEI